MASGRPIEVATFLAVAQCGLDLAMKGRTFFVRQTAAFILPLSFPLVSLALNPSLSFLPQVKPRRRLEKDIRKIREKRKGSQATALGDRKFQRSNTPSLPFFGKEECNAL